MAGQHNSPSSAIFPAAPSSDSSSIHHPHCPRARDAKPQNRWHSARPVTDEEAFASSLFPLHCLSVCHSGERAMCQFSRSITSRDISSSGKAATDSASNVPERPPDHHGGVAATSDSNPTLSHRMRHDKSILALAVSSKNIYAGTQGGEILVFCLDTYERQTAIEGHKGSVLGLCLSEDENLLFSSATDPIVNVWCTTGFVRLFALYSTYDVGDIFCVAYSSYHRVVYLGSQNTSIQWYDLNEKDTRPPPEPTAHPSHRPNRFFDSSGPGGIRTPRASASEHAPRSAVGGQILEIDKQYIRQFAHYGYVYCMLLGKGILPNDPAEEVLVSGGGDGLIRVWHIDPKLGGAITELFTLEDGREEGESIFSLAREGTFLYSGRIDGEVNVWDLETKQLVRSLRTECGDVLTLSLGGGFLFAGGATGIVEKFNPHYETISTFRAHEGLILASAFATHNGKPTFITGGNDDSIVIWDVEDCATPAGVTRRTDNDLMVESLNQFIAYRTVSSLPKYRADCRRGASYLRSIFKNFGAVTEMINTADSFNPIVFAKFRGNPSTAGSMKKILFYGHYDVIPAEDEKGRWKTDPFCLTGEGGYLYGRGVSDNKGPIMAAIYAAHELTKEQCLDSDIIFLIEGEEECGSRGFADAVRANKALIGDIDWILLANSYWLDDHVPCLTYGLRGVIHATVQIESKHPDLHSGVDGSSLLDEPLKDLVMLLSKLTGLHGRVQIPGFYDPILPLTSEERALYDEITETLLRRNPDLGDPEVLAQSLMRRWREASLTIHRFQTSGPDNSTIIPRLARAALSIRLVPNQESSQVAQALTNFLSEEFSKLESKNHLKVTIDHQAEPWLGDYNNEIFQTLESAIKEVWGPTFGRRRSSVHGLKPPEESRETYFNVDARPTPATSSTLANGSADTEADPASPNMLARKPLYIREGGSIPSIRFLEKEFGAPAAHMPCGQASDSAHLDNERLRLLNLFNSKAIFKKVFRELPEK